MLPNVTWSKNIVKTVRNIEFWPFDTLRSGNSIALVTKAHERVRVNAVPELYNTLRGTLLTQSLTRDLYTLPKIDNSTNEFWTTHIFVEEWDMIVYPNRYSSPEELIASITSFQPLQSLSHAQARWLYYKLFKHNTIHNVDFESRIIEDIVDSWVVLDPVLQLRRWNRWDIEWESLTVEVIHPVEYTLDKSLMERILYFNRKPLDIIDVVWDDTYTLLPDSTIQAHATDPRLSVTTRELVNTVI